MKYDRIWNFNAGPSAIPVEVLEKVQDGWFNYRNSGMNIMEMSHRSKDFDAIHNETIDLIKQLLGLDDGWHVLMIQGGASLQFAMAPMNFLHKGQTADYINTGTWSTKAIQEAKLFGNVNVAFDGNEVEFKRIPKQHELKLTDNATPYCKKHSQQTPFRLCPKLTATTIALSSLLAYLDVGRP